MENEPQRAVLLIADISGYTKFMINKRKSLVHAQAIITELMKSIIAEIKIPLQIVEVEGDAVFFCGVEEPGTYNWEQVVSLISKKIPDFFYIFYHRLHELESSNMCHCDACDGISQLKLKIVAHIGEALFYEISNFSKLGGPDVILVHRLLKNSLEANEYLMMTETSFLEMSKYREFEVDKGIERYNELGEIIVYVHYPNLARSSKEVSKREPHRVSFYKKLKQTMKIGIQGMLIMLGLKKPAKFRNLPNQ